MNESKVWTAEMVLEALLAQTDPTCIGRVVDAFGAGSPAVRAYDHAEVRGERHALGPTFVADAELEAMAAALNERRRAGSGG